MPTSKTSSDRNTPRSRMPGRLKRRAEFLRVAGARRNQAMPGLVLQAWTRSNEFESGDAPRVGFTASKKVGNAVARNRARRRLRAAVSEVMPELALPGTDYVVIARKATLARPYADLRRDLARAMRKLDAAAGPKPERGENG